MCRVEGKKKSLFIKLHQAFNTVCFVCSLGYASEILLYGLSHTIDCPCKISPQTLVHVLQCCPYTRKHGHVITWPLLQTTKLICTTKLHA